MSFDEFKQVLLRKKKQTPEDMKNVAMLYNAALGGRVVKKDASAKSGKG